jgi:hypothetical protein
LTGLITCAQLQLRRIAGAEMELEVIRFANLDEFFRLSEVSDQNFEYTVRGSTACLAEKVWDGVCSSGPIIRQV